MVSESAWVSLLVQFGPNYGPEKIPTSRVKVSKPAFLTSIALQD